MSEIEYIGHDGSEWTEQTVDPSDINWEQLIRLAETPNEGDYKEVRSKASETAESVLRQFHKSSKASAADLGRLLAARVETSTDGVWKIYYGAMNRGYFHEVGDVAFVSDNPGPVSREMDAIEW